MSNNKLQPRTCEANSENQILVAFTAQAVISLTLSVWVIFLSHYGRLGVQHTEGTIEYESEKKRLEMVSDILMVGNDIQMLTGRRASDLMFFCAVADIVHARRYGPHRHHICRCAHSRSVPSPSNI